jgi:hypothetical protein
MERKMKNLIGLVLGCLVSLVLMACQSGNNNSAPAVARPVCTATVYGQVPQTNCVPANNYANGANYNYGSGNPCDAYTQQTGIQYYVGPYQGTMMCIPVGY